MFGLDFFCMHFGCDWDRFFGLSGVIGLDFFRISSIVGLDFFAFQVGFFLPN